jgi:glycolate oxidase FAD binding subunit
MPEAELTLSFDLSADAAITQMNSLACRPWPLSAQAYSDNRLRVRLSGAASAVQAAARQLGGDVDGNGAEFWTALREQQLGFFQPSGDLWRISLPPASPRLALSGAWLLDWNGALRWLKTEETATSIHAAAAQAGAYAVCFRGPHKADWFRLEAGLLALQRNIRNAFDPLGIFNPGRLFPS